MGLDPKCSSVLVGGRGGVSRFKLYEDKNVSCLSVENRLGSRTEGSGMPGWLSWLSICVRLRS